MLCKLLENIYSVLDIVFHSIQIARMWVCFFPFLSNLNTPTNFFRPFFHVLPSRRKNKFYRIQKAGVFGCIAAKVENYIKCIWIYAFSTHNTTIDRDKCSVTAWKFHFRCVFRFCFLFSPLSISDFFFYSSTPDVIYLWCGASNPVLVLTATQFPYMICNAHYSNIIASVLTPNGRKKKRKFQMKNSEYPRKKKTLSNSNSNNSQSVENCLKF